jgi:FixJ family two-component response regulator
VLDALTDREWQIFDLVGRGLRMAEVAAELDLAWHSIASRSNGHKGKHFTGRDPLPSVRRRAISPGSFDPAGKPGFLSPA